MGAPPGLPLADEFLPSRLTASGTSGAFGLVVHGRMRENRSLLVDSSPESIYFYAGLKHNGVSTPDTRSVSNTPCSPTANDPPRSRKGAVFPNDAEAVEGGATMHLKVTLRHRESTIF